MWATSHLHALAVRVLLPTILIFQMVGATSSFAGEPLAKHVDRLDESSLSDSWERSTVSKPKPPCQLIDQVLIVPVIKDKRADAIILLEQHPVISLNESSASKLTGAEESSISAGSLIRAEIDRMQKKRDLQLNERVGGWSAAEENRLHDLLVLSQSPTLSMLSPFLVRAIAKNEFTGGFGASICGSILCISHFSLGNSTPKSIRLPVVIFLSSPPKDVYLTWRMAQ